MSVVIDYNLQKYKFFEKFMNLHTITAKNKVKNIEININFFNNKTEWKINSKEYFCFTHSKCLTLQLYLKWRSFLIFFSKYNFKISILLSWSMFRIQLAKFIWIVNKSIYIKKKTPNECKNVYVPTYIKRFIQINNKIKSIKK